MLEPVFALQIEAPSTGRMLDFMAGGGALVGGASAFFVACTLLGLAAWAARAMRPSGAPVVLARWMLGGAGTFALWLGVVLLGAGVEAVLDRPLAQFSGAPSVLAWWLAFRVGAFDAAITAALAKRLSDRTGSPLHTVLFGWAYAVGASAASLSLIAAGAALMIAIGMLADALV